MSLMTSIMMGEGFQYDDPGHGADWMLLDTSGMQFGVFNDMLNGGGNLWKGMTFGAATRPHDAGEARHVARRPLSAQSDSVGRPRRLQHDAEVEVEHGRPSRRNMLAVGPARYTASASAGDGTERLGGLS